VIVRKCKDLETIPENREAAAESLAKAVPPDFKYLLFIGVGYQVNAVNLGAAIGAGKDEKQG
jgi:hypothetical protein